ncbi:MAG: UDP-N-acetylmuramate--L-alanine ligase [Eubacteriales bacterium SKADARSKE-1]|nr:UDP-N-acetylmuramate--L-alanine ligase [Eubacteriales bacterium SKADARSKE-1]
MNTSKNILNNIKKIHFIGIGGSGMYPIAKILHSNGYIISGSDNYESDTLDREIQEGLQIYMGHDARNIDGAELIVYSAAIKQDNPEMIAGKEKNIPTIERSVMLGLLTSMYKNLIAVSGTHGKTTTTSMITQILTVGGADPTAIVGGTLPFIGGNSRTGNSETIVCEACEYVDTFLELDPAISVITNVEADHLDYFKTFDRVIESFNKFANKTTKFLVVNGDDENALKAVANVNVPVTTFGFNKSNDYYVDDIAEERGFFRHFSVMKNETKLVDIELKVPGRHNAYNALAAICVADYMGLDLDSIAMALSDFGGVHRRFEVLGKVNDITIIDDFAHHPTEIENTLTTASKMGFDRVIAIFQPHTYSRTATFLNEFGKALSIPDITVVSEILAVREVNSYNIYSEDLVAKIKNGVYRKTFEDITDYIEKTAKPGDCVITMGGGNVYKCANMILDNLKNKYK